jgi:hypothetical protein
LVSDHGNVEALLAQSSGAFGQFASWKSVPKLNGRICKNAYVIARRDQAVPKPVQRKSGATRCSPNIKEGGSKRQAMVGSRAGEQHRYGRD